MTSFSEKDNLILYKKGGLYGSLQSMGSGAAGSPKRVIYCVHGRPSAGCCTVTEGEIIEPKSDNEEPFISYHNTNTILPFDHCHRDRSEDVDKKARRKLLIASVLCVFFMICEIIGGVLSGSLAIATDAAHLLTDFASFMISLFSLWMASRPATKKMSFGWYRSEVIGALTSVLMIWVVTGILVFVAIQRIVNEDYEIDSMMMLITSAFGVGVNFLMGISLHQHGHSHGGSGGNHSHSNKITSAALENGRKDIEQNDKVEQNRQKEKNINVRAAYIHVIGDFIQSIGVFIAALIIFFKPEWMIVDPICTFFFSILVLATTYAIIKDTILVLMEGMPRGIEFIDVMNTFLNIDGVVRVHNLRIWALSLDKTALSAHLAIRPGISPQSILELATRLVHEKYDFFEMTLQIEEFQANMENCVQCKLPA